MFSPGKRTSALLIDRDGGAKKHSVDKFQVILDCVLEHVTNDERPYLRVNILGKTILGLMDSGASRTVIGSKGLAFIKEVGLPVNYTKTTGCIVANGQRTQSIGVVDLPVTLRGQFRLIEALIVPEMPHLLILGEDFWRIMGIVPDLRHNE